MWHACRCTSAAPMYFQSCGDYVDGGVMANNPSMAAWAEIQHYYAKKQKAPPHISIAVSVGTGIYPDKNMGDIDIFGKNFFSLRKMVKHVMHLIEMLRNAVSCPYLFTAFPWKLIMCNYTGDFEHLSYNCTVL